MTKFRLEELSYRIILYVKNYDVPIHSLGCYFCTVCTCICRVKSLPFTVIQEFVKEKHHCRCINYMYMKKTICIYMNTVGTLPQLYKLIVVILPEI